LTDNTYRMGGYRASLKKLFYEAHVWRLFG
jgi:hypothetical protein